MVSPFFFYAIVSGTVLAIIVYVQIKRRNVMRRRRDRALSR